MAEVTTKYPLLAKAMGHDGPAAEATPAIKADVAAASEGPAAGEIPASAEVVDSTPAVPAFSIKTLDEKQQLKAINEALGASYKSLDEARPKVSKSKEEIEAEKSARKQKALEWAFGTEKVKRDDYDKSVVAKSKTTRELALSVFTDELREENANISAEEAEEQFKDFYHEDKEDNSPLRKIALRKMEKIASSYLKENFGSMDAIDADYDQYETAESRKENYGKQIKSVLDTIPKELKFSIPYTGADGVEVNADYVIPIEDADIKAIRKDFLTSGMYEALGAHSSDINDAVISGEVLAAIKTRKQDDIIAKIATQHAERIANQLEAHYKAIPRTQPHMNGLNSEGTAPKKTPEYGLLKNAQFNGKK